MNLVFDNWEFIPPTEGHICQLHKALLGFSKKDERHRGEYKKDREQCGGDAGWARRWGAVFESLDASLRRRTRWEKLDEVG